MIDVSHKFFRILVPININPLVVDFIFVKNAFCAEAVEAPIGSLNNNFTFVHISLMNN